MKADSPHAERADPGAAGAGIERDEEEVQNDAPPDVRADTSERRGNDQLSSSIRRDSQ